MISDAMIREKRGHLRQRPGVLQPDWPGAGTPSMSTASIAPKLGSMTPTVLREDGFQFFFYSWESNEPPHVHVKKGGAYGKLWLAPVVEAYLEGFNPNEVRQIIAIVSRYHEHLLQRWNEYFGGAP